MSFFFIVLNQRAYLPLAGSNYTTYDAYVFLRNFMTSWIIWYVWQTTTWQWSTLFTFFLSLFYNFLITIHIKIFFSFHFLYHINNFIIIIEIKNSLKYKFFLLFYTKLFTLYHIYHFLLILKNNNNNATFLPKNKKK